MALAAPKTNGPMLPPECFAGRLAIVTDAGDAIGTAIAVELARCGASIALVDATQAAASNAANAVKEAGGKASSFAADLGDTKSIAGSIETIEASLGPVTILVNHVRRDDEMPVEVMTNEAWRAVTARVLDGTLYASREVALRRIADGRGAAIVNSCSPWEVTGGAGNAAMEAALAGVMNLVKSLAVEWAPYDIRVNGIAPGYVAGANATPYDEAWLAASVPAGRLCSPQEVAWCVAYMCSPFAGYLTGHAFVIDGASWQRPGRTPPLFEPIRARYDGLTKK